MSWRPVWLGLGWVIVKPRTELKTVRKATSILWSKLDPNQSKVRYGTNCNPPHIYQMDQRDDTLTMHRLSIHTHFSLGSMIIR